MTAAWLRHLSNGRLVVHTAGVRPSKSLHATAVEMMREVGIDLTSMGEAPKHWTTWVAEEKHDFAAFVCPNAEAACEDWGTFAITKLSWPTEDPGDFIGNETARLAKFREVRNEIKERVSVWLAEQGFPNE
jgi:arsenate reductase (thioredoxin)